MNEPNEIEAAAAPDGPGTTPATAAPEMDRQSTREIFDRYAPAPDAPGAAGVADGEAVDPLPDGGAGGLSARDLGVVTKGVRACLKVLDRWNCKVIYRKALAFFGDKPKAEAIAGDVAAMPEELDAMAELTTLLLQRSLMVNRNSPWIAAAVIAAGYALRTGTAHMQLSPDKPATAVAPTPLPGGQGGAA